MRVGAAVLEVMLVDAVFLVFCRGWMFWSSLLSHWQTSFAGAGGPWGNYFPPPVDDG